MISIKRSELRPAYDAVVIGAGVGGLVCAGFLRRAGLSVLLCDHHYLVGGYCTAFPRKNYRFDACVHHIGGCGKYGTVGQILKQFGIRQEFVRLDPMDHLLFEDLEVEVPADLDQYQQRLAGLFPHQAERIPAFFQMLVRLNRQIFRHQGELLERYVGRTFQEMAAEHLEDERLIRVLGGQWGYLGPPLSSVSAVGMAQMLVSYLRDGAWYPLGSTQSFSDNLARNLLEQGGHVLLKHRVQEVLVEGGRAAGIRLEDGRTVRAGIVVCNADARTLFEDLLPAEVCPGERSRIQRLVPSSSYYGLYMALAPELALHDLPRGFYFPGAQDCEGAVNWIYLSITTRYDSRLAANGDQILSATVGVRTEASAYRAWQEDRDAMVRSVTRFLETRTPRLGDFVKHVECATPRTLQRYTLAKDGVAYGWAVLPDQSGDRRLAPETSLDGLYLAGQWTMPGPGVAAVAASGWLVANRILRKLRNLERASP
ncbi:MAG: NAD(P)/FAD-dependent oxidoreductase [Planctomycetota bacterium]|nr:MAG: NAD(P)/FAD-dependent oxidoreductase [Planctomycetota bacterium]